MLIDTVLHPGTMLVVGIVVLLFLLIRLKLHPFLALIVTTFLIGILSPEVPLGEVGGLTAEEFGGLMIGIGIPILMAAIIGKCLIESGAAERIVRTFRGSMGENRDNATLLGTSYLLSIPVFFDNVFYVLTPIARAARAREGEKYFLYLVAIIAGGSTAHALVPPTPGPLAVSTELGIDIGQFMIVGGLIAIPAAVVPGILYAQWMDRRMDIPLRDALGTTAEDLIRQTEREGQDLPGTFEALLPIILVIGLVASDALFGVFLPDGSMVTQITGLVGDPNIALTIAALMAAWTYYRVRIDDLNVFEEEILVAVKDGGNIIAITAAGGAFGGMLAAAGIGEAIIDFTGGLGFSLLVTGYIISGLMLIATGSLTVAMITTAGIMAGSIGQLDVHPIYLALAIGAGSMVFPWHNNAAFWVITEVGGLKHHETIRAFSLVGFLMSVTAFTVTLILSTILPNLGPFA
ncbi:GntP family permease [Natrialba swarupiae]|uniref:GntP family permease n=2 Tax=Natrialba swarupiae TaxID=2448032 RepID=A0A5D5AEQ3_9EURY|nr:GntP family permease [Natrialba swarupiae]